MDVRAELCELRRAPLDVIGFERKLGAVYVVRLRVMHPNARVERAYGSRSGLVDVRDAPASLVELDSSVLDLGVLIVWQPAYDFRVRIPPTADRLLGRFCDRSLGEEFVVFSEYVGSGRKDARPAASSQQQSRSRHPSR